MNPSSDVCKIDAYPDTDFAGMYGHEEHTDPACTKSWTGFIIIFCRLSCLLVVQATDSDGSIDDGSRNHSSFCMLQRAVSFNVDMVSSLTKSVKLPIGKNTMDVSCMKTVWEHPCAGEDSASTVHTLKQILRNQDNLVS